jgi:hypothetical protein
VDLGRHDLVGLPELLTAVGVPDLDDLGTCVTHLAHGDLAGHGSVRRPVRVLCSYPQGRALRQSEVDSVQRGDGRQHEDLDARRHRDSRKVRDVRL